jgi:proton-translocating NADH-quinone oxidoreductase chain N
MGALESLFFIRAELFLLGIAFLILILDFFVQKKTILGWLAITALAGAILVPSRLFPSEGLFFGYFTLDSFTHFFRLFVYIAVGLTILASFAFDKIQIKQRGELYFLLLSLAVILPVMAAANNLLMIFIAIESVSITSYILVGFQKFNKQSSEASLKYLLFGSVSSAIMLLGMSLLFAGTQTIWLTEICATLKTAVPQIQTIGLVGLLFLVVGIGFKISAAPFHMWAPDVYHGAPTPIAGFLTVAPKALGFAVLARVVYLGFPHLIHTWSTLFVWLSILTMTLGNIIAISQSDIKRLLAYSSISQAGYILAALATPAGLGLEAVLIYVVVYLFTNLGAFFSVLAIERNIGSNQLEDYKGLSQRSPVLALALMIFLLSLTGIPPLAGFIGKLYIFASAIKANAVMLAIVIGINSAFAAFYYFKIIKMMYLVKTESKTRFQNPFSIKLALGILLLGTILIGLFPAGLIRIAGKAISAFPLS